MPIYSYPSVFALGHVMVQDIFKNDVVIEEKIDGSQYSFGVIEGELQCRSKGKQLILDAPEKMFLDAVRVSKERYEQGLLKPGYIYRGEYLQTPKHGTLPYNRIPKDHLIIFDISTGLEQYMTPDQKWNESERIGLECVPILFMGKINTADELMSLLDTESILGGTKIEGVVVKNYHAVTKEKKMMMGKYVREEYKETQKKEWRSMNPTQGDILQKLILEYKTEARWRKAMQHLEEQGILEHDPRDIGNLIKEVRADILKEEEETIKQELFDYVWPKLERAVTGGLPEFYKEWLLKRSFK